MSRPSQRLYAIARQVENAAQLVPDAMAVVARRELAADGYGTDNGEPNVTSTAAATSVEAAMLTRQHWSNIRAEYDANITAIAFIADDLVRQSRAILRGDTLAPTGPKPASCDPSGRQGYLEPLADGGWSDLMCHDLAVKDGLCGKHYQAERRWRQARGLPTRKSILPTGSET